MTKCGLKLLVILCLFLCNCTKEEQPIELHSQITAKNPIEFPLIPSFHSAIEKTKPTKDNIYTTWAAIFNQNTLMDSKVRIQGNIIDISADCPEITRPVISKKKGKAKKAAHPVPNSRKCRNLTITINSPEDMHAPIILTGYHPYYHPHFKIGMPIDVSGKYVYFSNGLVSSQNGLIQVDEFHNIGVNANGFFTDNRIELNKMISKGECL